MPLWVFHNGISFCVFVGADALGAPYAKSAPRQNHPSLRTSPQTGVAIRFSCHPERAPASRRILAYICCTAEYQCVDSSTRLRLAQNDKREGQDPPLQPVRIGCPHRRPGERSSPLQILCYIAQERYRAGLGSNDSRCTKHTLSARTAGKKLPQYSARQIPSGSGQ